MTCRYQYGSEDLYNDLGILHEISYDSDHEDYPIEGKSTMECEASFVTTPLVVKSCGYGSCKGPIKQKKWLKSQKFKKTKTVRELNESHEDKFIAVPIQTYTTPSTSEISKIPNEILIEIFKYLDLNSLSKAVQVCRTWRSLGLTKSLWASISLKGREIGIRNVENLLGRKMQALCLNGATVVHGNGFDFNANRFHPKESIYVSALEESYQSSPHKHPFSKGYNFLLVFLDLSNARIRPGTICLLLSRCPYLTCLSLEGLSVGQNVASCVANCPSLLRLNLSLCKDLSVSSMVKILQSTVGLLELNVGWSSLCRHNPDEIFESLPRSLTHLNVSGFRNTLNNGHVGLIASRCSNLKDLDLSDSNHLTTAVVDILLRCLTSLIGLSLSRCYSISNDSYLKLRFLPNLKYVDVFGVMDDASVDMLSKALPSLFVCMRPFSSIAKPTPGFYCGLMCQDSIWGQVVKS